MTGHDNRRETQRRPHAEVQRKQAASPRSRQSAAGQLPPLQAAPPAVSRGAEGDNLPTFGAMPAELAAAAFRPDLHAPPAAAPVQRKSSAVQRTDDERDRNHGTDRRGDRRSRREEERDRRTGRPEGGRDALAGSHFQSDWAGRAILARYLRGGGDWHIVDNPQWSAYMMGNETLRAQMRTQVLDLAQVIRGENVTSEIDRTMHANMENGEGIVGYQYLHGSNADVGDFRIHGTGVGTPTRVTMDLAFTWNDMIDPNPQYSTDNWKSAIAETITLGQADAYSIHITWSSQVTVDFDAAGNVTGMTGYPFSAGGGE